MKRILSTSVAFTLVALATCSKKPDWVEKGGKVEKGVLYGIGIVDKTPSQHMNREMCQARARNDLAKAINSYVASLVKDFTEQHRDYFNEDAQGLDEFSSVIIKQVSEATIVGAVQVDSYDNGKIYYCLLKLEADKVIDMYKEKMKQAIREQHRAIVKERAEEALKALDEQIQKKREAEIK